MNVFKIKDTNFVHNKQSGTTSPFHSSEHITWLRSIDNTDVIFFTDNCLHMVDTVDTSYFRVAWIIEPRSILPHGYSFVKDNHHKFNIILSHNIDLVNSLPNCIYCPFGTSWIPLEHWKEYEKTKLVSMIASNKLLTIGHRLRHRIINKFSQTIDIFGSGVQKPIEFKTEGLKDYCFSIAIENCRINDYFSEKLIDCFATYTVPIYWGFSNIDKYFNSNGIITFNKFDDLDKILSSLSEDRYKEMLPVIKENYETAKEYKCPEDYIGKNILPDILHLQEN